MDKKYLTYELIEHIKKNAQHPVWKTPGLVSMMAKKWYDVIKVTGKGLIFFEGNSDTGFTHISERHNFFSHTNYFNKEKNPSKFSRNLIPIEDYINVADDIYSIENKEDKEHPDNNLFDKYIGESDRHTRATEKRKFHLVLYKETKIVHSLYPAKSFEKIKTTAEFGRCRSQISATQTLNDEYMTIFIPYENDKHIIRYIIVLRFNDVTGHCKIYIQVNYLNGKEYATEFFGETNLQPQRDMQKFFMSLDYANLSLMEKRIIAIEKEIQDSRKEKTF